MANKKDREMKDLSNTNYGKELKSLGYGLKMWAKDAMGNKRKYMTSPISGSGAVCFFDSLSELRDYCKQVRLNRAMEELSDTEWQERLERRSYMGLRD